MKKICIIFGYYTNGLDYFCKISKKHPLFFDEIYGFEALPQYDMKKETEKIITKYKIQPSKIFLENKAIYINNEGIMFHNLGGSGSSILKEKMSGTYKESLFVPSVDIKELFGRFDLENTQFYISMNIEGAEFAILEYMFNKGVFDNLNIKEFYLDNHTNISGKVNKLKQQVINNNKKLSKYFKHITSRPMSGNPNDFFLYN